ncbi:MAG: hypothetical protein MUE40_02265 [Anaerolineae bacterium]|nr:hypothetical protein [Anaerolineae bacterium]
MDSHFLMNVLYLEQQRQQAQQQRHKPDIETDAVRHFLPDEILKHVLKVR